MSLTALSVGVLGEDSLSACPPTQAQRTTLEPGIRGTQSMDEAGVRLLEVKTKARGGCPPVQCPGWLGMVGQKESSCPTLLGLCHPHSGMWGQERCASLPGLLDFICWGTSAVPLCLNFLSFQGVSQQWG